LRPNTDSCAFVSFEAYSMSRAYSQDLRDRVLAMAARFGIGVATAIVWVRRERQTGNKSALPRGKSRGSKLDAHAEYILRLVAETPDITLKELRSLLLEDFGTSVGVGTLWNFFDQRSITFKKKRRTLPNNPAQMS
jgi:transposase